MSGTGPAGPCTSLTQGSSAGSPPPSEAQAPPGALYIFPWLPLYFPSAEAIQIKEDLNLLSFHSFNQTYTPIFFFFLKPPRLREQDKILGKVWRVRLLIWNNWPCLSKPWLYYHRGEEGKRWKVSERTREWGEEKQARISGRLLCHKSRDR